MANSGGGGGGDSGGGGDDGIYFEALSSVALRTITIILAGSKILVVMRSSEHFCFK